MHPRKCMHASWFCACSGSRAEPGCVHDLEDRYQSSRSIMRPSRESICRSRSAKVAAAPRAHWTQGIRRPRLPRWRELDPSTEGCCARGCQPQAGGKCARQARGEGPGGGYASTATGSWVRIPSGGPQGDNTYAWPTCICTRRPFTDTSCI